jgi:hypothetical protein
MTTVSALDVLNGERMVEQVPCRCSLAGLGGPGSWAADADWMRHGAEHDGEASYLYDCTRKVVGLVMRALDYWGAREVGA